MNGDIELVKDHSPDQAYFTPKLGRAKNWAKSEKVQTRIKTELHPLLNEIRDRRKALSDMWRRLFKVWTLEHEEQGYTGRSNIYVPAGKKGTETLVSQLVSGTFPGDDYFDVQARQFREPWVGKAGKVKDRLRQRIENAARVRVYADMFYRQLCITGNSPVKIYWKRKVLKQRRRAPGDALMSGMPVDEDTVIYDAPVFQPLDVQNTYWWPETASRPDEAEIVFQDLTVPLGKLRQRARRGDYLLSAVNAAQNGARNPDREAAEQARNSAQGIGSTNDTAKAFKMVDIVELQMEFDPEADSFDDEANPRPFLITMTYTGEVLRAIEHPYWHRGHNIRLGRMGTVVERLYGTGFIEGIRELNILLNDQTNQGMDCATWALNPAVIANPDVLLEPISGWEPGIQILATDINRAIKMERPDQSVIQATSILTTQTQAWISDFIGAPPVLQGGSSPGRAFRSATGVGTAQRNAMTPLQEVIRLCEAEVWEPMLQMFHSLDEQFAGDDFISYFGGTPERMTRDELAGNWMFRWLASTQAANAATRGSQIVQLLSVLSQPGIVQQLQANKVIFNPAPLIKRLYQEVYGFRDVDQVLLTAQTLNLREQRPAVPSALNGGGQPPQLPAGIPYEGEGEELNDEFLGMREEADAVAAEMGGLT